jgi:TetR/AcrR family transcriptional regulator
MNGFRRTPNLVEARLNKLIKEYMPEYVNERRRQKRAVHTRERILEVAYKEFASLGYEATSTRTIAEKAGVKHPMVTYHFKSKEGLWRTVLMVVGSHFTEKWQARLTDPNATDDLTKLRLIQEDFVRFAAANPGFHWLMANEGDRSTNRLKWLVDNRGKGFFAAITKLIASAQKIGRYVEGDPYHLQYLFIGAVTRIFMQCAEAELVMGKSPFAPAFVEQHVRTCCALFFRDPPKRTARSTRGRKKRVSARKPRASETGR